MNVDGWPALAQFATRIGVAVLVAVMGFVVGVTFAALWLAGGL